MVCFAVQVCSLLLLCLLLSSLSAYCALSCCSGLFSVAVVPVLSSSLACLLWFILVAQVCVLLVVACFLLLRSVFPLLRFVLVAVVLVLSSLFAYFFLCFAFSVCCCVCAV